MVLIVKEIQYITTELHREKMTFSFSTQPFTQPIFIKHQFCMRCYEAEREMNSTSSLLQLNPVPFGKDGGDSPEMGSLGNQRNPLCFQGAESLTGETRLKNEE